MFRVIFASRALVPHGLMACVRLFGVQWGAAKLKIERRVPSAFVMISINTDLGGDLTGQ